VTVKNEIRHNIDVYASMRKISAIDIFCGVGGLTHGLISGGIHVSHGIDSDIYCQYPYEANNQATFLHKDVKAVTSKEIHALFSGNHLKLVAGCAPCQPFSTYSRKGRSERNDHKWNLLSDFGRIVSGVRPELVTMENVPQLIQHHVYGEFLSSLSDYHIWHGVIDCAEYGIPQSRKRLVLLASRLGPIQMIPPGLFASKGSTVRDVIGQLPALAAGETYAKDIVHTASKLSELNLKRIRASRPGGTWRDWPNELIANCHERNTGKTYPSVYGRMEWDAPAPTMTTQCFGFGNGRFGHPTQDRAISLREAALIQTFPADYKFVKPNEKVKFNVLGRLIGNAVPVSLARAIAKSLTMHVAQFRCDMEP